MKVGLWYIKRLLALSIVCAITVCSYALEVVPDLADTLSEVLVIQPRMSVMSSSVIGVKQQFSLRQMETERRVDMKSLSAVVPNMYIPDYGSRMTSSIYVRGLGARIDQPVLGVYIDGIGVANKNSFDFSFFDVQRVKVSRGPQGTLFGRNTIGGVMQIETLSPLVYQGTRAYLGYGNANQIEAGAGWYKKFSSQKTRDDYSNNAEWGLGVTATYRHTDGLFLNEYNGKKADRENESGIRVKVDGRTAKGVKITNTASYNFVSQGGFAYHLPQKSINHNDPCLYERHNVMVGSNYTFDLEGFELGGTTSYQYLEDKMTMDQDYLPLSYFTLIQAQKEHFLSQDVTIKNKEDDRVWDWLSGLTVSYKHNTMYAPVTFKQAGIDSLILKNANAGSTISEMQLREQQFVISSDFKTQNVNLALYHTSFWKINHWRFEAGIRCDYEGQVFDYDSHSLIHIRSHNLMTDAYGEYVDIPSSVAGKISRSYFELLPKVGVQYRKDLSSGYILAYGTIAEGYKAGGFNTQLFSDILRQEMMRKILMSKQQTDVDDVISYNPERCLSSEFGLTGESFFVNGRFFGSLTLYELELFNQQLTIFPEMGTGRQMTNAGRSRSIGGELSALVEWKQLKLAVDYGYTYAYFLKYIDGKSDYAGNRVPYMPSNTVSASINYTIDLKHEFFHSLDLNLNTTALGQIYWNEQNDAKQNMYALLNASISLRMRYLTLQLWGRNLTNTHYDVFSFVSMGNRFMQSGKPITFGIKLMFEI